MNTKKKTETWLADQDLGERKEEIDEYRTHDIHDVFVTVIRNYDAVTDIDAVGRCVAGIIRTDDDNYSDDYNRIELFFPYHTPAQFQFILQRAKVICEVNSVSTLINVENQKIQFCRSGYRREFVDNDDISNERDRILRWFPRGFDIVETQQYMIHHVKELV